MSHAAAAHSHNIIAHVDPYEEVDYRKSSSRVRANPLLVKIQTGKGKATVYNLPPEGFTYGKRDHALEEGVKEVVNSWQKHTPAPDAVPGRDFVKMNRTAVVKGAVSSKDIAAFRSTHDARVKQGASVSSSKGAPLRLDPSATFGRPSKPSTPIHDVLTNTFQRNAIIQARRSAADAEARRLAAESSKAGKFGSSQHTRASLGHMKIRAPASRAPFKLNKFQQVPPRIGHQGYNTLAANADNQARQLANLQRNNDNGGAAASSSQPQQQHYQQEEKEQESQSFHNDEQQQSRRSPQQHSDSRRTDESQQRSPLSA